MHTHLACSLCGRVAGSQSTLVLAGRVEGVRGLEARDQRGGGSSGGEGMVDKKRVSRA